MDELNTQTDSESSAALDTETSSAPTQFDHGQSSTHQDPATGQPIEIDSLDKYRYQGRQLKDWESGYMRQQDYTQKTTQLAQERKYFDNLAIDLDRVRQNPSLAEQFRSIYPDKFHPYLRYVTENSSRNPNDQATSQHQQQQNFSRLDPAMEVRIHQLEKHFRDQEVASISAELDHKFRTLTQKYPFADEEAVVARAQALLVKIKEADPLNPNIKISDKQWDLLWKSQHERAYGLSDSQYKKQVQSQIQANRKGADVGRGGGTPGHAPREFRTLKEATNAALADIESGSL